jgi:hypothetical protein
VVVVMMVFLLTWNLEDSQDKIIKGKREKKKERLKSKEPLLSFASLLHTQNDVLGSVSYS